MGRELLGGLFFKEHDCKSKTKGLKMFLYLHSFHRHTHIDIYMCMDNLCCYTTESNTTS